jgi:hypothetical protein
MPYKAHNGQQARILNEEKALLISTKYSIETENNQYDKHNVNTSPNSD